MATNKTLLCYCYIDGELQTNSAGEILKNKEGIIVYRNGRVNAVPVTESTKYEDFVSAVGRKLNVSMENKIIKYTTSAASNILLHLSNDEDLQVMVTFNDRVARVYIFEKEVEGVTSGSNCPPRLDEDVGCLTPFVGGSQTQVEPCETGIAECEATPRLRSSIYKDCITEDQLFNSANEFRQAVYKFSIAHHFPYKWVRNTTTYLAVQCRVEGCSWRITARKVKDTPYIKVKKFKNQHQHDTRDNLKIRPLVRTKWIASMIESTINQTPDYLPRQISKDLQQDFAIQVQYHQSWHCKERLRKNMFGVVADSYNLISWMCNRIIEVMPGSVAICTRTEDNQLNQLFIAYHSSLHGFRVGCRPLLFVHGTYLSGPYKRTLLAATAIDANDVMFPIAYAVVSSDNHEDWLWFLQNLKAALDDAREIIIISDRHESIIAGVATVFSSQNHAFCLCHLKRNFSSWLSGKGLRKDARNVALSLLTAIAKARSLQDFEELLLKLDGIHPECSTWIRGNAPEHWANLFFPRKRWDMMSLDQVETYNGWFRMERQQSILSLIRETRGKLGEMIFMQHNEANGWKDFVGPNIAKEIKKNVDLGHGWIVRRLSSNEFEVETAQEKIIVDLANKTCGCRKWEMTGIPCEHACQAIERDRLNFYQFVEPCYHKDTQIRIYSTLMRAVSDNDMPITDCDNSNEISQSHVIGPNIKRRAGRPRTKHIDSQFMDKRTIHCKRCNRAGHNRKTCKEVV